MMKKLIPFLVLFCMFHFYEIHAQATCDADIIDATVDVQDMQVDEQHAGMSLTATNMIEIGGEATYKAGTEITLSPGFHAKEGSELTGLIEDCELYLGEPFITQWDFTSGTITIPAIGPDYDYDIDWGNNGTWDVIGATGVEAYTAAPTATIEVAIRRNFPRFSFGLTNDQVNADKFLDVLQWGTTEWDDMFGAFMYCSNLEAISAIDIPDLTFVTSTESMFAECSKFNGDINDWVVTNVKFMGSMFRKASKFKKDLNNWNTENVEHMGHMFEQATEFNGDITTWNVGKVKSTQFMFFYAEAFDRNLNGWNVSKVENMSYMFNSAFDFNQPLGDWEPKEVTTMSSMFNRATSFNQDLSWGDHTTKVIDMSGMFRDATSFNGDVTDWNVDSVQNMIFMFYNAENFNQNLGQWEVIDVTDMSYMLSDSGMLQLNYENTLNGWASLTGLELNVELGADGLDYCIDTGRNILTNPTGPNWTILGDNDLCGRPLSTDDIALQGVKLYPNPAEDRLFIEGVSNFLSDYETRVLDVAGRVVLSGRNLTKVDVSQLQKGVYFLQILGENKITKKFLKL